MFVLLRGSNDLRWTSPFITYRTEYVASELFQTLMLQPSGTPVLKTIRGPAVAIITSGPAKPTGVENPKTARTRPIRTHNRVLITIQRFVKDTYGHVTVPRLIRAPVIASTLQ